MKKLEARQIRAHLKRALHEFFTNRGFEVVVDPRAKKDVPLYRKAIDDTYTATFHHGDSARGVFFWQPWFGIRHEPTMAEYKRLMLIPETGILEKLGIPPLRSVGDRWPTVHGSCRGASFDPYDFGSLDSFLEALGEAIRRVGAEGDRYWETSCNPTAVEDRLMAYSPSAQYGWLRPIWFAVQGRPDRAREVAETFRALDIPSYDRFLEELLRNRS